MLSFFPVPEIFTGAVVSFDKLRGKVHSRSSDSFDVLKACETEVRKHDFRKAKRRVLVDMQEDVVGFDVAMKDCRLIDDDRSPFP